MFEINTILLWVNSFSKKIHENKLYLDELDSKIGDGDHGTNLEKGILSLEKSMDISQKLEEQILTPEILFQLIGTTLLGSVGGASGPLYGAAFMSMSKRISETTDQYSVWLSGLNAIKKLGNAELGDKTMVDVWENVVNEMKDGNVTNNLIEEAVQSTLNMEAKKGRASYLGERSIGHLDPGAVSSGMLFKSILENMDK